MTRIALSLRASASPALFRAFLTASHLPAPHQEYRFDSTRRWKFDWAWPEYLVALETEGGVWTRGRHTRGTGFVRDMEKYNAAALAGWRVLRVQPQQLCSDATLNLLRQALAPPPLEDTK